MSLLNLLAKTQQDFVTNENLGTSELIEYKHSLTDTVETVRAFCDTSDYNYKERDKTLNEIRFSNVLLTDMPSKTDLITYDGLSWNVRTWSKSLGMYTIVCDNDKRNKVSSRSFV